jgi:hypothetical protein
MKTSERFSWERVKQTFMKLIELWPDLWAVPAVIITVWVSYYAFALLDPSMGTFDMGILQACFFVAAILVTFNALVFLGIKFNQKELWGYYKDEESNSPTQDLKSITPWQRLKLLYCFVAFQFLLAVAILAILI